MEYGKVRDHLIQNEAPDHYSRGSLFLRYGQRVLRKSSQLISARYLLHGIRQFVLHARYDTRVQVEGATHLGPLPLFGNRQICRILFPTLLSPRNSASTPRLDCPQSNATSREPCRLQQLHSGCLN